MNIIQTVLGLLTGPQLLGQIAGMLGVPVSTVEKGLAAAIPAVLGGLISKGSTDAGAGALIDLMKGHKIDAGLLDNLGGLLGGGAAAGMGGAILTSILGGNADAATRLVGSVSGMPDAAASKLMAFAAPAVLGGVAQAAPAGGFTPAGLASVLASQKEHVEALAPPGLSALLGLGGGHAGLGAGMAAATNAWSLGPWLIGAGAVAAALFLGVRSCAPRTEAPPVAEAAPPVVSAPAPVVAEPAPEPVAAPGALTLPSGATLTVPPGSVGENLFKFLTGPETGSKTFVFDGLTFDTGRATLDGPSQATIAAIATILKEFPTVTAALDGYTDNQGSPASNLRLSQARAKTVMEALAAAGVDAARLTSAGHGVDKPIADNATAEGRAQNRRTELTATKR